MSKVNLYIDCTNGISGDMFCRCLTELCGDIAFVESQQKLISDELHHEEQHKHSHDHGHSHDHDHDHSQDHSHDHDNSHGNNLPKPYTDRSFQSILSLLSQSGLDDKVKNMAQKIYTVLAKAEAHVHGETLETVHFHEVGRPQAIINMVGIAAAYVATNPEHVYCSTIMDGTGTVLCAHGEISVPVPAVSALMETSDLSFATKNVEMEMVTPTGLASLLAMEPIYMEFHAKEVQIIRTAQAKGERIRVDNESAGGLKTVSFLF